MSDNPNTGWAIIPPWILADRNLSANEKLIAGRIWGLSSARGYCWASNAHLGVIMGLSPKTISKIITSLNTNGYVRVEVIRNEKYEIVQRRAYPLNPLCPKESIGIPQREHAYTPESGREYKVLDTVITTTAPPPTPVVVTDENSTTPKPPCLVGNHKCSHFKDLDTANRAILIFHNDANNKTIKNPIGYICGICRKGATLPPDYVSSAVIEARKQAEKAAKEEAEKAEAERVVREEAVIAAFLKLPESDKINYINDVRQSMELNVGEVVVVAVAAGRWAEGQQ